MILTDGCEKIGRGQFLTAGLKARPIAQRCILSHSDNRCFTGFSLDALLTPFTGVTLFTLRALLPGITLGPLNALLTLFAGVTFFALRPGNSLFPLGTRTAPVSLNALRAVFTLRPLLPNGALLSGGTAVALFAPFSPWPNGSLRSRISLGTGRSPVTLGADRAGITAHTLQPHAPRISFRAGVATYTLWPPRPHGSNGTPRADRTRTALFPSDSSWPHRPLFSANALLSPGPFRPHRPGGALDGHISAAYIRLAAVSPAASGIIVHNDPPFEICCFIVCAAAGKVKKHERAGSCCLIADLLQFMLEIQAGICNGRF